MFPLLPRWFTAALRMRARSDKSVHLPDGTQRTWPSPPNTPSKDTPSHDHALLESLNKSVYEHRFINMKPTGKCVWILGDRLPLNSFSCFTQLFHNLFSTGNIRACDQVSNASIPSSASPVDQSMYKCLDSRLDSFFPCVPKSDESTYVFILLLSLLSIHDRFQRFYPLQCTTKNGIRIRLVFFDL